MNKLRVYALCFGAFLVGVLVSALVSTLVVGGSVHAAPPPQANPHTAAPILCGGCVFRGVNGDLGNRLAGKDLRNAILPGSNLLRANLTGTDFSGADLDGITWGLDTARSARFVGADVRASSLFTIDFTQANFTNADLAASSWQGVTFSGANFTTANLKGASDLGGNVFTGAIWSNTTCPDGTNSNADGGTCIGHL